MTRHQYNNQRKIARNLARQDTNTEPARRQYAAAILAVVHSFNGRITAYTARKS